MALAVPLSRFTPLVGGGSTFFVRCHSRFDFMGLIEYLDKLIVEHSSSVVADKHRDFIRAQAAALEKKVAELETENATLKKRVGQLEAELSEKTRLEEFVEHHEALFKRKPGGGYHTAVYCPRCKQSVSSFHTLPYDCSCGWSGDFNHFDLTRVMKDLP